MGSSSKPLNPKQQLPLAVIVGACVVIGTVLQKVLGCCKECWVLGELPNTEIHEAVRTLQGVIFA